MNPTAGSNGYRIMKRYPIQPRHELAFWATFHRMLERAAHQAPAREEAYKAYLIVGEHAAEKAEYWRVISEVPPGEPSLQKRVACSVPMTRRRLCDEQAR
jgi:hypothetical protein